MPGRPARDPAPAPGHPRPPGAGAGALGNDAPVAVFVLEEEAHDRDPAVTLAEGVLKAKARALRPPGEKPAKPRPGRYRWDPLRSMMHRGTARLRHDIQAEDAIRHAALQAAAEPPRTTAEGAQHALALQQGVERPDCRLTPRAVRLRRYRRAGRDRPGAAGGRARGRRRRPERNHLPFATPHLPRIQSPPLTSPRQSRRGRSALLGRQGQPAMSSRIFPPSTFTG